MAVALPTALQSECEGIADNRLSMETDQPEKAKLFRNPKKSEKKLQGFIEKYKLQQISNALLSEGITVDFLISQSDQQIDAIARELTSKVIQQNKFKFAVRQIKKSNDDKMEKMDKAKDKGNCTKKFKHKAAKSSMGQLQSAKDKEPSNKKKHALKRKSTYNVGDDYETIEPDFVQTNQENISAIDRKTQKLKPKFGAEKTVTTWYYCGSDNVTHEIILKHETTNGKSLKSKRSITVDGKQRYSKKSDGKNFIITELSDDIRVSILIQDPVFVTYELYINDVAFSDLMNQRRMQSMSLSL